MGDRTSLTLYEGMTRIMENAFINVKNRSHSITAELEIPAGGGEGVILCQGGKFAGWSFYMKDGKLSYVHNWFGRERYTITTPDALPAGEVTVRYEFTYEGGEKPGQGGTGALFVGDRKVAEGRIDKTVGLVFSADETADVGVDYHTNVTPDYPQHGNRVHRSDPQGDDRPEVVGERAIRGFALGLRRFERSATGGRGPLRHARGAFSVAGITLRCVPDRRTTHIWPLRQSTSGLCWNEGSPGRGNTFLIVGGEPPDSTQRMTNDAPATLARPALACPSRVLAPRAGAAPSRSGPANTPGG